MIFSACYKQILNRFFILNLKHCYGKAVSFLANNFNFFHLFYAFSIHFLITCNNHFTNFSIQLPFRFNKLIIICSFQTISLTIPLVPIRLLCNDIFIYFSKKKYISYSLSVCVCVHFLLLILLIVLRTRYLHIMGDTSSSDTISLGMVLMVNVKKAR